MGIQNRLQCYPVLHFIFTTAMESRLVWNYVTSQGLSSKLPWQKWDSSLVHWLLPMTGFFIERISGWFLKSTQSFIRFNNSFFLHCAWTHLSESKPYSIIRIRDQEVSYQAVGGSSELGSKSKVWQSEIIYKSKQVQYLSPKPVQRSMEWSRIWSCNHLVHTLLHWADSNETSLEGESMSYPRC